MELDNLSAEILEEFIRIGGKLSVGLANLSSNNNADIDEVFRLAHTLKAAAHYAKAHRIHQAVSYLENVLTDIKNNFITLDSATILWLNTAQKYFEKITNTAQNNTLTVLVASQELLPTIQELSKPIKNLNVLYVEDDAGVRDIVTKTLKNFVNSIEATDNAQSAIELFEDNNFDIVILDLNLPGKNGFWLAKELKSKKDIPIIATTGHNETVFKFQASQVGIAHYITKPFSLKELTALLEKF